MVYGLCNVLFVDCWLLFGVDGCVLLARCSVFLVCCLLFARCSLFIVRCLLIGVGCFSLFVVWSFCRDICYSLCVVCR